MRIETALKRRDSACQALRDLFRRARMFGHTHADMLTEIAKLDAALIGCPEWVHSYVKGYQQCLFDGLYENALMFGGLYNGKFYSTHSNRDDYYGKHGIEASAWADDGNVSMRGHYWIVTRGEPRAFFLSHGAERTKTEA